MVKKNDRIELVYTDDKYTTLKTGDKGTVLAFHRTPWERQIEVEWDNGSTLLLLEGIDKYKIITEA